MTSFDAATSRDTALTLPEASPALAAAIANYSEPRGYLAAASIGLPTIESQAAMRADLDLWAAAQRDPMAYDAIIDRTRASYATLVGIDVDRVAMGSQTSVIASIIAAAVPDGAEVLCVDGDFSSMMMPFAQRPSAGGTGIRLRSVPLAELADAITADTWLVAFSHVQSSTGVVADIESIVAAASANDTFTFCDTTQSAGVVPVDASLFDATVCHTYKWLCSPRGVAFLTLSERFDAQLTPLHAGWYAGEQVWQSCYGAAITLAANARRFDVSPAWQAWVGAEPALRMFASLDIAEVWARTTALGDAVLEATGHEPQRQAIVTWFDPDGSQLQKLAAAGIRASGRAGRLRLAFHLWNDETDVAAVVAALT
ncbi:aminotransferase class V-fold PLP-dependent enzyme [soil metagenome]